MTHIANFEALRPNRPLLERVGMLASVKSTNPPKLEIRKFNLVYLPVFSEQSLNLLSEKAGWLANAKVRGIV